MYYILIVVFFVVDQIVKIVVRSNMTIGESFPIIGDFFRFTYIENSGAAFSMFEGKTLILVVIPVIAMISGIVILNRIRKNKNKYNWIICLGISMVIGGGIGNLVDRLKYASVTDYFDLKNFAVFNFADIFVCIGCLFICGFILFIDGKNESKIGEKI